MEEKMEQVNSLEYWDRRFASGDWDANQGMQQTRYFYALLVEMLPDWLKDRLRERSDLRIVDFGCAEGDGVPVLSGELGNTVVGVDFSSEAVRKAAERYAGYVFEVADIWHYAEPVDVAILSNIIEHFPNPYTLLEHVAELAQKYVVVMVPLEETELMTEHCYTFRYQNIPISAGNMQLIYFAEHDCREDPEQLFLAKQVMLVYAREETDIKSVKIAQLDGLLLLRRRQQEEALSSVRRLAPGQDAILAELRNPGGALQTGLDRAIKELAASLDGAEAKRAEDLGALRSEVNAFGHGTVDALNNTSRELTTLFHGSESRLIAKLDMLLKQSEAAERSASEMAGDLFERFQKSSEKQSELALQAMNNALEAEGLKAELAALSEQNTSLNQQYSELVGRFNSLNDHYGFVVSENVRIVQSRTYRAAELQKKLLNKLHILGFFKLLLSVRRNGWKEAMRLRRNQKTLQDKAGQNAPISVMAVDGTTETLSLEQQWWEEHSRICESRLREDWTETTKLIAKRIGWGNYKGIVVYPHAVHWEPVQRPQHILRSFAKQGYLCFFCENYREGKSVWEAEENLFVVYGEEYLLPALQNKCPIVLITFHRQLLFCGFLPEKYLWFDTLDNLDFFSGGNTEEAAEIYRSVLEKANLVTYSADKLRDYVKIRPDAVKLNNAVNPQDFLEPDQNKSIERMDKIKRSGRKIVGYYGAIEEWFDKEALQAVLEKTDFEVVLIGRCGIDLSELRNERLHLIGEVPYRELKEYAKYFDVAWIPFIVNKLTDSVSPVKFFEYAAQGKPVVSSAIHEMQAYACDMVQIYHNYDEMTAQLKKLAKGKIDRKKLRKIGNQNSWDQRVRIVEEHIFGDITGLKALADYNNSGMISLECVTFFKYDGTNYYSGGAERYLLDLDEVCRELDIYFRVYQYAEYNWVRFYGQTEVVGMPARDNPVDLYSVPLVNEMYSTFQRESGRDSAVNIFSPFYIVGEKTDAPSVGISHGISWDSEYNHFTNGDTFWQINKNIIDAASVCDRMISVDTNTCNWFQTLDYDTGRKIKYVPNYVDGSVFYPRENFEKKRDRMVITYPRRLYAPRGLYVVLDIIDEILTKYVDVEFHFVGKGFEEDTKHVDRKIAKWNGRVKMYSMPPDRMCEVYRESDISLVPTIYSEGTSLSCLEAMSSGNAVICTRIGGLTDLVLDGYNGIMIEPNSDSLRQALFSLLDSPEEIARLKQNAVQTAKAFSKEKWKHRWKDALKSTLGSRETARYEISRRCRIDLSGPDSLKNRKILESVRSYLEEGYYVYLACRQNPEKLKSYHRLQFIDSDEDLYFKPELHLTEKDLLR